MLVYPFLAGIAATALFIIVLRLQRIDAALGRIAIALERIAEKKS